MPPDDRSRCDRWNHDAAETATTTDAATTTTAGSGAGLSDTDGLDTLDDPFVDTFGNTGYDVTLYDLTVDRFPDEGRIDRVTVVEATATQDLSSFTLDLVGFDVVSIAIDGAHVDWSRDDTEIRVQLPEVFDDGTAFTTTATYSGVPIENQWFGPPPPGEASGWHTASDCVYVFGEPVAASTWHPANDHPIDKAPFRYTISAPEDQTVATVGTLQSTETADGRTTWVFDQPFPMAPYLTTLLIGGFDVVEDGESSSDIPIRNVFDRDLLQQAVEEFSNQRAMMDVFEELFGPYPFDVYGSAVVEASFGAALETQTLSIYSSDILGLGDITQSVIAHELAHQWFGNNVSVERWSDIWLNEGFATYAEGLWQEASDPDFTRESWINQTLQFGPALEAQIHPPALDSLFGIEVYQRGGLTMHALRVQIGDDAFFDLLKEWNIRFGGGSASSDDFEALAEELSGKDLSGFFDEWLRQRSLPAAIGDVSLDFDAAAAAFEQEVLDLLFEYEACLNEQGDSFGLEEGQTLDQAGFDLFTYLDGNPPAHEVCGGILAELGIE